MPSYVIYNIETTRIVSHGKYRDSSFKSERAAKAHCTRKKIDMTKHAISESVHFNTNIELKETRHGVGPASGKTYEVPVNTSWTSGPWSETYFSS